MEEDDTAKEHGAQGLQVTTDEADDQERPGRRRNLTEKGHELFEEHMNNCQRQLDTARVILVECLTECEVNPPQSKMSIEGAEQRVKVANDRYLHNLNQYIDFLARNNTTLANEELEKLRECPMMKDISVRVVKLYDFLDQRKNESSSRGSRMSTSKSLLNIKKAEAEGARAKYVFERKRAALMEEQNKIKLELDILEKKGNLAAKEAEVKCLEQDGQENDYNEHRDLPNDRMEPEVRTERYVQSLPLMNPEQSFAQYMSRRDILKDRIHSFNGRHEHYLSWKDTFTLVMSEIAASAAEELDLLLRWSGPGARQIQSIKTANSGNPSVGLTRAWYRLDIQFGSPEKVEQALKTKLHNIPRVTLKDKPKLFELSDVLSEIRAVKENDHYSAALSYLDSSTGINPTISKLPLNLQNKWRDRALSYKRSHGVLFPPFTFFCNFVQEMAESLNDPSFDYDTTGTPSRTEQATRSPRPPRPVSVAMTTTNDEETLPCFIHKGGHSLSDCRTFRHKGLDERKGLLKQHGVCFKCCLGKHLAKNCTQTIKCGECNNQNHNTAMHVYKTSNLQTGSSHGGEKGCSISSDREQRADINVDTRCTELCDNTSGKSCAKIVLVNVSKKGNDLPPIRAYAIIDDQSNHTLAKSELFDNFNVDVTDTMYTLRSCAGKVRLSGRRASGFIVESIDGLERIELPTVTECEMIPDNRNEIPTPKVASSHPHLSSIAGELPPLDTEADILLLLGRDVLPAHHVLDQKLGDESQPFAQKLKLGWVIVGECCLDGTHLPQHLNCMKTCVQSNGRPSTMELCTNTFESEPLFKTTKDDNKVGLSWEDKQFELLMADEMKLNEMGNWQAPLPFKEPRPNLPNNRQYAVNRTRNFISSLHKNLLKQEHALQFMQTLFDSGHAVRAYETAPVDESWYLPLFGIYHPKKKDKIRIVFDSSAKHKGLSLNDVLMTGPNLTNNLLGVLMRFRKEKVAVMADIQQMFYSFYVSPQHRDYLRFVWPENNDLINKLVDYKMNVHVFGNSPSPAVATYGLHKTADLAEEKEGPEVRQFVKRNFYVDDALSSHSTSEEAINLLKSTQGALQAHGKLRLHKICSNSADVLAAFHKDDLASDLKDMDLEADFPLQRSLGVYWNVRSDAFTFSVTPDDNVFTRQGVLSTINGLYDPLGLVAAVTITGKLLLRECLADNHDWDEPLPGYVLEKWQTWKRSLDMLKEVQVPRPYCSMTTDGEICRDLYVYSDASEKAVAAVAYLMSDAHDDSQLGFVLGKAKVAPKHGNTIPRLELCAAVLAVEVYEICRDELDIEFRNVKFYTDSKVVLGYIHNQCKRFFIYVGNRVDRIRASTSPHQWNYVPSSLNPADDATRGVSADDLPGSKWLNGPSYLLNKGNNSHQNEQVFPLVVPEDDHEIRTLKIDLSHRNYLRCGRFERFSSWTLVITAVARIQEGIRNYLKRPNKDAVSGREHSKLIVISSLQNEIFMEEINALRSGEPLLKNSRIRNLSPYIDDDGLLRVGGRLKNTQLQSQFVNPIIVPKHHLSMLIVRHYHEKTHHQGRLFTEGAIRNAGFWLLGCKQQVNSYIHKCFLCKKNRGKPENQKMSDLPMDRLDPVPPFTNIGIDVFGPWIITTRKTRGGEVNSKRWALMFTCLVVRAVHIEILEDMTSSCFINALRRFCALRGEVKIIRSDRGTNFVGSTTDMRANVINVEDRPLKNYLVNSGINWIFNPPHSSHMGGVWERMIGVTRKILDSMLAGVKVLTHELITTLMAEVAAIINARPLSPLTCDPDVPQPLSPATLLYMKTDHTVKSFQLDDFNTKDLFKTQWKRVQHLANTFWTRWRSEYLPTLQPRRKWLDERRDPETGDVVLICDKSQHRNDWPIGVVVDTHISEDGRVRALDVRLGKDRKILTRPSCDIVTLLSGTNQN